MEELIENETLKDYIEDEHLFSFEGVKGNCYIRLSASTVDDLQEEINNIFK